MLSRSSSLMPVLLESRQITGGRIDFASCCAAAADDDTSPGEMDRTAGQKGLKKKKDDGEARREVRKTRVSSCLWNPCGLDIHGRIHGVKCSYQSCTRAAVARGNPVCCAAPGVASSPTRPAGRFWSLTPTDAPAVTSYTDTKGREHSLPEAHLML